MQSPQSYNRNNKAILIILCVFAVALGTIVTTKLNILQEKSISKLTADNSIIDHNTAFDKEEDKKELLKLLFKVINKFHNNINVEPELIELKQLIKKFYDITELISKINQYNNIQQLEYVIFPKNNWYFYKILEKGIRIEYKPDNIMLKQEILLEFLKITEVITLNNRVVTQ